MQRVCTGIQEQPCKWQMVSSVINPNLQKKIFQKKKKHPSTYILTFRSEALTKMSYESSTRVNWSNFSQRLFQKLRLPINSYSSIPDKLLCVIQNNKNLFIKYRQLTLVHIHKTHTENSSKTDFCSLLTSQMVQLILFLNSQHLHCKKCRVTPLVLMLSLISVCRIGQEAIPLLPFLLFTFDS